MNGGSRSTDSASASCWRPSAPKVAFRLPDDPGEVVAALGERVHEARRSPRGTALSSALVAGQLLEQAAAGAEAPGSGSGRPCAAPCRARGASSAEPLKKSWRPVRVCWSKRSKISSSSTAVAVWSEPITPPSSISSPFVGTELEVDVAVGDAGQRGLLDQHARAAAQRRVVVVVDRERDLGRARPGSRRSSLTLPTVTPPALHLVALHELAGVHELRGHAVAAVAPEQQDRDDYNCKEDQSGRYGSLLEIRTSLRAQSGPSCAH